MIHGNDALPMDGGCGLCIVFVGAGNLATNMALSLADAGLRAAKVVRRTASSASRLAGQLGCGWACSLDEAGAADVYVISVVDSVIADVAGQLARLCPGAVFCHTAGSVPMSVFGNLGIADYGVLYPLQTFSRGRRADFSKVPVFIEHSTPRAKEMLLHIASKLSAKVHEADSAARLRLHVASVFACNFTNRMYALAERVLLGGGLPFSTLLPLIDETVAKVHHLSPAEAQTGPASRGDSGVVARHMELLSGDSELHNIYDTITKSIMSDGCDKP